MNEIRLAMAKVFAFVAFGISGSTIIGYVSGNSDALMWTTNRIPMALPTAISLFMLSLALLILPSR